MDHPPRKPPGPVAGGVSLSFEAACWCPAADLYQGRDAWLLKLELAGVRREDVAIELRGRRLRVTGVRRDWQVHEGERAHSMEITYNRFERTIELPCDVDAARITSELRDGMLLVRLPVRSAP